MEEQGNAATRLVRADLIMFDQSRASEPAAATDFNTAIHSSSKLTDPK